MNILFAILIICLLVFLYILNNSKDKQETFSKIDSHIVSLCSVGAESRVSLRSPAPSGRVDKIIYINLDHRIDRNQEIIEELTTYFPDTPIIRLSAIYQPDNGALGCLQSHIMMLKYALYNFPGENVLFCEDDLQFLKDPKGYIYNVSNDNKFNNWDVVMVADNTNKSKKTENKKIVKVSDSQTASCYLVKSYYIPKILEIFEKDLEIYNTTKIWKTLYCNDQSWKILQKKDNWYAFTDKIASQRKSYSDIEKKVVDYKV